MLGGAICACAPVRTWRFSRVKASQSWKTEAWFGITDIKNCFHNMRIPDWFSDYFSLLHVAAWEAEIEGSTLRQNGRRVFLGRDTSVTPALAVLPMRVLVVLVFCSERHNLPRTCTPQPLPSSRQVGRAVTQCSDGQAPRFRQAWCPRAPEYLEASPGLAAPFALSLAEALGSSGVVGDRVSSTGTRSACHGTGGNDRAPFIRTPRGTPAHEAARSCASTSRGLAELLDHRRCRRDRQACKGADVERHARAWWASRSQARPLLGSP